VPIAKIASRVMAGEKLANLPVIDRNIDYIAVKEAVFPWARFPGVDPVLSPEMKSTGEVMGIDRDFATAFAKSQLGAGTVLPDGGTVFVSVKQSDKAVVLPGVKILADLGFKIIATSGTAEYLAAEGIAVETVNKVAQGRPHIVDRIQDGDVALIFNTTEGWQSLKDSMSIRASALAQKVPYFTTAPGSVAAARAIAAMAERPMEVSPIQAYFASRG
jgi:carbamoyl-phosphate synthase large subunit